MGILTETNIFKGLGVCWLFVRGRGSGEVVKWLRRCVGEVVRDGWRRRVVVWGVDIGLRGRGEVEEWHWACG